LQDRSIAIGTAVNVGRAYRGDVLGAALPPLCHVSRS